MGPITRRTFLGITVTGIGGLWLDDPRGFATSPLAGSAAVASLYKNFQDPDRKHSIRPFWFWNGKLDGEELGRQIRQMVEHGVFGAYAHNRDGLETPYLSEEWWQAVGAALKVSREVGFSLCMVDEFEWPSGEARDYWMPGINKSRVVAANPEFRMQRLRPIEKTVNGPQRVEITLSPGTALVVAGRQQGQRRLAEGSLQNIAFNRGAKSLSWDAPDGEWLVTTYVLEPTYGLDGGTVDLMNPAAVGKFIEIYYEEFYRRYGEYFGNALPATFADHEGTYGGKLAWTPRLFEAFQQKKGYNLEPLLPALTYDTGPRSEKLRCDYQDVISDLYTQSFFKQVNEWCRAHKLEYSGHVWEESLFFGPAYQGDFYRIQRALSNPGCDSLVEWAHQSVWLKELASIADFEGRRLVCENQGGQGGDSYLPLEHIRRVSNGLGAWNVGEFIPHAFNYDLNRINFPPDWFRSQPFLPYFHFYADQMRRISFMNCDSHHVADILLYYPQVSIWGQSAPVYLFEWVPGGVQASSVWPEDAVKTNSDYAELKLRLSEERLDYKVADDSYLAESRLEGKELLISSSRFRALVLPPMSTLRRSTAERVAEFYRGGGTVIAHGRLPVTSVEEGRDDSQLRAIWDAMFDTAATLEPFTLRSNVRGGRAYFVPGNVENLVALLGQIVDHDVEIVSGPTDHLYVLHKQKEGIDFYWIVNDTPSPRTNLLRFRAAGRPERWDAVTGKRDHVYYQSAGPRTLVRLTLHPWDATYIVFDPEGPAQSLELNATNLDELVIEPAKSTEVTIRGRALIGKESVFVELKEGKKVYRGSYRPASVAPLELTGLWTTTVESPTIQLPYAYVKDDPQDRGLRERWFAEDSHIKPWDRLWLSPMNCTLRKWNVIGSFPNPDDHGLELTFPPERELNFDATYEGDSGHEIRWLAVDTDEPRVAPERSYDWDWALVPEGNGRYAPGTHVIDYGTALKFARYPSGTVFAQTYVYAPQAQEAVVALATPCPRTVWWNGQQVYTRWVRPMYHELKDGFAVRIPVNLNAGWNSLLLKFLHNPERPTGAAFTCRVERPEGNHIKGLAGSLREVAGNRMRVQSGFRWLAFPAVPLSRALRVPAHDGPWSAFIDGRPVGPAPEIPLPRGARKVVLRVSAGEVLDRPFELVTAPAPWALGTWNIPGLEHFSGSMIYEKTVEVPAELLKERVLLDCGQVGVTAEVWVNNAHAGARPWQPYVFDVTDYLRARGNHFRVRVANTEANARAVGDSLENLKRIDVNGWLGPARLVPFVDREIRCVADR
jgi:glycosyl hydrolase family 106( putative alpha-L-rhamnosidase)/glycosyl hydrolase family 2